jgi:DNA-binding CsgD family transcriptional regulator
MRRHVVPPLPPPPGLTATRTVIGDEEVLVLSFPLAPIELPPTLTAAEKAVVGDVARGATNAEIAKARGRSTRTIANQLASVYRKLGVSGRAELSARLRGG